MIELIKCHPSVYYSYNCGEYVRRYCTMPPQHTVKTNMLLLTPLGYRPDFISGMLITQNDLCFCSLVLTPFRNHVELMQPAKV